MDPELDKCASLIKQTFGLAHDLNLSVLVGIELPTLRRFWSSNCAGFRNHFERNLAVLGPEDFWLDSKGDRGAFPDSLASDDDDDDDGSDDDIVCTASSLANYYDVKIDLDANSPLVRSDRESIKNGQPVVRQQPASDEKSHSKKKDERKKILPDSSSDSLPAILTETRIPPLKVERIEITGIPELDNQVMISRRTDSKLESNLSGPSKKASCNEKTNSDPVTKSAARSGLGLTKDRNEVRKGDEEEALGEEEDVLGEEEALAEDDRSGASEDSIFASPDLESITSDPNRRPCVQCGLVLHRMQMDVHVFTVHEEMKSFLCAKCGRGFQSKTERNRHANHRCNPHKKPRSEKPRTPNPCHFCGVKFETFVQRQSHMNSVHLTCSVCKALFPNMWVLKEHVSSVHEKLRPFPCPKCGKLFGKKLTLNIHDKQVHQPRLNRFICPDCGKGFMYIAQLKKHSEVHNPPERSHVCTECPAKFPSAGRLKVHSRTVHSSVKPHICKECGKGFCLPSGLKSHEMFKHGGEKKFSCSVCGKKFHQKQHLKRHQKTHEKGKISF